MPNNQLFSKKNWLKNSLFVQIDRLWRIITILTFLISMVGMPTTVVKADSTGLVCESFDSLTPGSRIGFYPGWTDDGAGPVVTAGIGVASSVGLATDNNIFNWSGKPFNWNATDFEKINLQGDFQTSSSGTFDDDRLSWTIDGTSTSSNNQFGVQLDPTAIVTYWSNTIGGSKVYDVIATLSGLPNNTWYRFKAEITKLTATSAKIDVSLVQLDASGNPTGTPITGSIADTSALASGHTPAAGYFTPTTMVPSFKNFNTISGATDNLCHEIFTGTPPVTHTLTVTNDGNGSVTLSPTGGLYNEGTVVTLTPVPNSGYEFDFWNGADAGSLTDNGNGTWSITMSAEKAVHANFAELPPLTNYGLQFDGTNDYVTFGPNLNAASFTLEAWVKRDSGGATMTTGSLGMDGSSGRPLAYPVLTKGMGQGETPANINMNWFLGITNTGVVGADFEDNAGGVNHPAWGSTVIPIGEWHHIAATYNGSCWTLYLDGNLETLNALVTACPNAAPESTSIQHAGLSAGIGSTGQLSTGFFDGTIDEARVWNVARTQAEIIGSINSELTSGTGLIGRWGMNENIGTTIFDSTDPAANGTLTNGPTWVAGAPFNITPPIYHTLTVMTDGNGSVTLSPTGGLYNEGTVVTLTPVPNSGYEFDFWNGADAGSLTDNGNGTWSITMSADKAVHANFAVLPPPVYDALDCGSSQAYVTFGQAPTLGLTQFTIETWFRRDGTGSTTTSGSGGVTNAIPLVTKGRGEGDSPTNLNMNYLLGIRASDNVLVADFEDVNTSNNNHPIIGTTPIVTGTWYHGAVTFDGSKLRLYLNGNLQAEVATTAVPQSGSLQHAALCSALQSNGTPGTADMGFFDGALDEPRIWNYARTQAEILSAINSEITSPTTGLVGRWELNEGTGTTVNASAGTTDNGTIVGSGYSWIEGAPFNITPPAQYTLTVNTVGNGSVTLAPAGGTYYDGTVVQLTAVPDSGWTFSGWSVDLTGTTNPTSITMNANKTVTATFTEGATAAFQDGVGGYTGTVDTYLRSDSPTANNATATTLVVDRSPEQHILLRFEDIFGSGAGQIPAGAAIQSATLEINVTNDSDQGALLHRMLQTWNDTDNWNTWVGGVNANGIEAETTAYSSSGGSGTGTATIDVTADLQAWLNNPSGNFGWALLPPTGDNSWQFSSSEGTIKPKLTVTYTTGPVNQAPEQPVVVQPLDNATGVSTSPTLEVTVTDPDSDPMAVTFWGRAAGGLTEDFTIIVLPDTQFYSESYPSTFTAQTQWIVNNAAALNIVYVAHEGDIVNVAGTESQWINADTSMDILDAANIPYGVVPGNHDEGAFYNTYFGVSRFTGKPFYGGEYPTGDNSSSYTLFSAGGMNFIVLNLDYTSPASGLLTWADGLLKTNSSRRAIVISHDIVGTGSIASTGVEASFSTWGQTIYDELKDNPNLFLMMNGHTNGEGLRDDVYTGNTVYSALADYQSRSNGGNGWLRILEFSPDNDTITVKTYSPTLGTYETDADSQFTLSYDMDGGAPFVNLGTDTDVTSGDNASIPWFGRTEDTEYEWYVEISDGTATTIGPTWNFTTVTAVNDAPVVSDIPNQTIAEGASFVTINLDEYVSDVDNTDAEMTWTYTGETDLTVTIDGSRVATIGIPSANWNGAETITFRAADPGALYDEDAATFTVTGVNDAPIVSDIPGQTIAEGGSFVTINLDDYVLDTDNTDAEMAWTYTGETDLTVTIDGSRVATIGIPSANWNGAETITFRATDPGALYDEDAATFTVTAVNDAPVVSDIPGQTIAEGGSFVTINLDNYVLDVDNTDAEMAWTFSGDTDLSVSITNRVATITIPDANWSGAETITFRATDPGALYDEDAATFTVTAVNDAPVVSDIPNQTIAEGGSFVTINLDDYVSDVDNTDAEMTWTYTGETDLTVTINGSRVATIGIPSADWSGAETITFRATDPGALYNEDAATFSVTTGNDTPVVSNIPNQTIAEGASFVTINLDEYVSDVDNTDAEMTWTYTGETDLTVTINGSRVATIGIPSANWNGTETITFRATDPGALYDSDTATFTVTAVNDAPVVSDIPNQTIAEGASFVTINLDNYVLDVDNTDAEMAWTFSGDTDLSMSITNRVATIGIPSANWNGAETITFRATDPGALYDEDAATFTVTAVNDAPVVSDIPNQTIAEGASFVTINLDEYVSDVDNTDAEMTWTYTGETDLTVTINGSRVATIGIPSANWNGAETITFRATDPGALYDSDTATFTVTAVNDAPVVSDIPNQTIAEGASFVTINLDNYVLDVDNTDAEMAWTFSGDTDLSVSITNRVATIGIPSANWNGAETITFRATDPGALYDEDAATFTVTAVNDAPVVSDIPNQTVAEGASFVTINLDNYVSDVDNTYAQMTWTYSGNVELNVSITNRVATITTPDANWNGAETITFRATDPGALYDEDAATFTVTQPVTLVCENFNAYTTGSTIGTYAGWYDAGSGPVVTAGNGVASSIGLAAASSIYNWTAHPFNWNDSTFQSVVLQQDFKTDGSGNFDDDRLSWTINGASNSSNNQFGVQLDHPNGGIVTYWSNVIGGAKINDVIVPLSALTANTWYRFNAEITKLTATSARIDVNLVMLDAGGNPTGTPITGTIANTSALASGHTPAAGYFTPTTMVPSYKNYTAASAPADNTCYEIVTGAPSPTITITGTPLSAFGSQPGLPSAQQSYTVSGSNLTANIVINAPADFAVSTTSGSGFTTSVTLTQSGGTVAATPIYVRFNRATEGTSSGDITHTSTGATPQNVAVSGTATESGAVTFAAFGDYGSNSANELAVANMVKGWNPEFIVTTGDNSYGSTAIDTNIGKYYSDFIGNYTGSYGSGSLVNRFFPAIGNHDYTDGGGSTAYFNYFTLPSNERYYDFVGGPVHFFVIDSNPAGTGSALGDGRSATSTQGIWLQAQLAASTSPWKIVYMHHPPFSSGSVHGSEVAMQWPYEAWGATAVLAGHDHVYERIHHDDDSDGVILPYFTTGAGGMSLYSFNTPVAGSQMRYSTTYGSMRIQASATSITFEFWSVDGGGTLRDTYTINSTPTQTLPINIGSTWKYLDNGTNQGTAWKEVAFDDSAWASGPAELGYGDGDEDTVVDCSAVANCNTNNYITTYFRYAFNVPDASIYSGLNLSLLRDDGAIVYLNGVEIWRTNMPAGAVTYTALASSAIGGTDETTFVNPTNPLANTLVNGTNVLAVEIHQSAITSTDISFDLSLTGVASPTCYALTLGHTGNGTTPTASPANSTGCAAGQYIAGQAITLSGAVPDTGWQIASWSGTSNNSSTGNTNSLTMPASVQSAGVNYTQVPTVQLTVNTIGSGTVTLNPAGGIYPVGTVVQLTAAPAVGYTFSGWTGDLTGSTNPASITMTGNKTVTATFTQVPPVALTVNKVGSGTVTLNPAGGTYPVGTVVQLTAAPASGWYFSGWSGDLTGSTNPTTITMTAAKTVTATFTQTPPVSLVCESFNAFTPGSTIGTYTGWYDGGSGPVVTAGNGVASSVGLAAAANIYNWTAHPFNWNDPIFLSVTLQQDFRTDGSGNFDDDRLAWTTVSNSTDSANQFGVQLDHPNGGIVTYWRDSGGTRINTPIVPLSALTANTWYRFNAVITKLTATSAKIDVSLVQLNVSGNPTGTPYTGTVPNTSTWSGGAPATSYFTPASMWPSYKNYNSAASAPADNTCYEFKTGTPPPQYTLTVNTTGSGTVTLNPAGGTYYEGTVVQLTAAPASGYTFSGWTGDLTGSTNPTTITMTGNKTVTATFTQVPPVALTVNTVGSGTVTLNPAGGTYPVGTVVQLTAAPASGWYFSGWSGDLTGSTNPTTITMTAAKAVTATFTQTPPETLVCESFNAFTPGSRIGTYTGWYDGGSGPVVTAGNGVASSVGLAAATNIYNWTAHPFNWNDPIFLSVTLQQDFRTDGSGNFDDDRLAWTTNGTSTSSDNQFGVQLDHPNGGIVTYWRDSGGTRIQTPIVSLSALTANTWYRFNAKFTKLTATSAKIDVSLVQLDASGNPTGTPYTGTVTNTSTWSGGAPATSYFTPTSMWPSYKNYNSAASAPADNTCYEFKTGTPPPQYTLTINTTGSGTVTLNPSGGTYYEGTVVQLTANPAIGYTFSGWTGDLTGSTNPASITMTGNKTVTATFTAVPPVQLTVNTVGSGTVTLNPTGPTYPVGTVVQLTAAPATDWTFSGWSGDLTGSTNPTSITMSAAKTVTATFVEVPPQPAGVCEGFESGFTLGTVVGSHAEWYDSGSGPVITSGNGLAGSIGLAPGSSIFTWTEHPFNWNDSAFESITFDMDFQTDASGDFDDDRIGWMTSNTSADSVNFFGVQVDTTEDGGIVTYWRDSAGTRIQTPIVALTTLPANTWYRLVAKITKLTDTSARIDVTMTRLDASGNPTGTPYTGTLDDTSTWPDGAPAEGYFTATSMWPAYKNHNSIQGAADNACFDVVSGRFAFVVSTDWHTSDSTPNTDITTKVAQIANWINGPTSDMPAPEFMVVTGDFPNLSETSSIIDAQLGSDFLWYPVIGNHEVSDNIQNFYDIRDTLVPTLPYIVNYGPTGSVNTTYSFDYENSHFVIVNPFWDGASNDHTSGGDIPTALNTWVNSDLTANDATHDFVFIHTPAYPAHRHVGEDLDANPANRTAFITTLNNHDVETLFSGHTHYYEHDVAPEYPLGNLDQVTNGSLRDGGVPVTVTYVLVEGSTTTYKVYSWNGSAFTPYEQWTIGGSQPTQPPTAPTALNATATSYANINLTWTDNADSETSFEIESSTTGSGGPFSLLTTVPADTESYANSGLTAQSEYCYRVRAVNSAGASVYSNVDCDTTPEQPPFVGVCEDFDGGFTIGQPVGNHADWYDGGAGPIVTTGNGVASSVGLAPAANIFTWNAQPFNWNDSAFQSVNFQMDFQTNASGQFDDDRMGWMTTNASTDSNNIFGAQLDHSDGGIVTYWRNSSGTRIQTPIAALPTLTANTWYHFQMEVTKLTATSAKIDVSLVRLDASGNPTGTPYTGTVTDTSTWSGGSPAVSYFTPATLWPAYKNHSAITGAADNACYETITGLNTVITSKPLNPSSSTAIFAFTSTEAGSSFECKLDAESFSSCSSPKTYIGLSDGSHTFEVRAIGAVETDLTPATYTWTVNTALPDPLVGYWRFDESSGVTADDSSVYGNDGTVNGAVWTSGKEAGALSFDGSNDRVQLPNSSSLSLSTNQLTISGWIYPTNLTANWNTIIQRTNTAGNWFDWQIYARASDAPTAYHPVFRVDWNKNNRNDAGEQVEGSIILQTNTWYYITTTYDGTAMKFYIDGVLSGTTAKVGGIIPTSSRSAWVGGNDVWGEYFTGKIDEFRIYNIALNQAEIQALMAGSPVQRTLTVNTVGSGTVTKNPDKTTYNVGEVVQLTAAPLAGWSFTGWSGACTGTGACSVTMDADKTVTAIFTQGEYTLTVNTVGSGAVTRSNSGPYHLGDIVDLTPVPAAGWSFSAWTGDCTGSGACSVTMDANRTVTATFTQNEYTLTVNIVGSGTVTLVPNQIAYHYGDSVQLTATPDAGWNFSGWSGDINGGANQQNITMDGSKNIIATFEESEFTLTVNVPGGGGTVTRDNPGPYHLGDVVTLTPVPEPGFIFSAWGDDCTGSDACSVTMDGNKVVNTVFTEVTPPSSDKSITTFSFIDPAAVGLINEASHTIVIIVPVGTDVTALVATFTTTGVSVAVGDIPQESGITPNDFTIPVIYTVTADDGTTQTYTVTVQVDDDGGGGGGGGEDAPIFEDVPFNYWANSWIETLYNAGITAGCGTDPLIYCPNENVTRAQMAIFILRGIHGGTYTPPLATGTVFGDIYPDTFAAAWIEQLAREGITGGCGNGKYCPDQTITRAEMSIFLLRGEHGNAYTPPAATGAVFVDVPLGSFAADWIEQLALEGITAGCGDGNYCPDGPVTRAEMAVFLVKAFTLP